jgi:hypothetical protein
MTIQPYEPPAPLPASLPGDEAQRGPIGWVARLRAAAEIANYIGATDFVPESLRGNPAAIAAAILYGDEIGLDPMQSLAKIAVIRGRPSLTAEGMRGLVLSRGHELWLEESTTTRAIAAGRRQGSERIGRVTWTLDDAKRAGIAGQQNYQRYPREMLVARATAALARQMFADVVGGLLAAEELDGEPDNGVAPVPDLPAPPDAARAEGRAPARRRRPAPATPAAAEPVPPTPPPDEQPEPEPPAEPLATDAYKRRIFATMRDLAIGAKGSEDAKRTERLAYTSKAVGRTITSSNELTIGEAQKVIDQLEADKAARLAGEEAVIDALRRELDAREVPAGAADSAPVAGETTGDVPAAETPAAAHGPPSEPAPAETGPVPYNEFPEGF